jgi:hypothetical protein
MSAPTEQTNRDPDLSGVEHDGKYFVAFDARGQWLGDFGTCQEALAAISDAKERQ